MINKLLTKEKIQKITLHDSFISMLNASITWADKWDAVKILIYWWEVAFPESAMTDEDLNENLIDTIRKGLLIKGGVSNPKLKDTKRIQQIKNSITFTEE